MRQVSRARWRGLVRTRPNCLPLRRRPSDAAWVSPWAVRGYRCVPCAARRGSRRFRRAVLTRFVREPSFVAFILPMMPLVLILLLACCRRFRSRFANGSMAIRTSLARRVTAIRISDDGEIRAISEGSLYVYAQGRWQAPAPATESWTAEQAPEPAGLPVQPATAFGPPGPTAACGFGTAKGLFHQAGGDWSAGGSAGCRTMRCWPWR
jgi:hypothetical protein